MNEMTVKEVHLSQKFLIVITEMAQNFPKILNDAFELLWRNNLMDSHVLIQEKLNIWSLFTFIPYRRDCYSLEYLRISTFTSSNFTDQMTASMEELYPEKLKDLNQCPLYVATSLIDPFVIPHNGSDGETQFSGIDIDIITEISKALNFKIVYKQSIIYTGHGVIFENGTATENLALVSIFFWSQFQSTQLFNDEIFRRF